MMWRMPLSLSYPQGQGKSRERQNIQCLKSISLSMPAIVGANGVESDVPINLNGEEALKLKESADALKKL